MRWVDEYLIVKIVNNYINMNSWNNKKYNSKKLIKKEYKC